MSLSKREALVLLGRLQSDLHGLPDDVKVLSFNAVGYSFGTSILLADFPIPVDAIDTFLPDVGGGASTIHHFKLNDSETTYSVVKDLK